MATGYCERKRDKSKKLLHLPEAWADRWANTKVRPSEVVNQARITVAKIRADAEREVGYFPRDWKEQHQCDIMYERDFGLVVAKKVSRQDLWSNYLILTRSARLKRMREAQTRMRAEARQRGEDDVGASKNQHTNVTSKLRDMIPGNYVVSAGCDLHDRLVVRAREDNTFCGYYVHQHGEVCQNPDPFTIQV